MEPPAHPPILVFGYSEAAMFLRSRSSEIGGIISICGKFEPRLDVNCDACHLDLEFDDADEVDMTDPDRALQAWARQKYAKEMGRPVTPPRFDDAESIIDFALQMKDSNGFILCQCQAGVSRSSAAALLCLAAWTEAGQEEYCAQKLLEIRSCAVPLRSLVAYGDQILGREGRLISAMRSVIGSHG